MKEFYRNKYGIKIVKTCASCIYHTHDFKNSIPTEKPEPIRCSLDKEHPERKRGFLCGNYKMIEFYKTIGGKTPTSTPIRAGYSYYVSGWRSAEAHYELPKVPTAVVREEFRKSPFANIDSGNDLNTGEE